MCRLNEISESTLCVYVCVGGGGAEKSRLDKNEIFGCIMQKYYQADSNFFKCIVYIFINGCISTCVLKLESDNNRQLINSLKQLNPISAA